jgi:hypothetical protein
MIAALRILRVVFHIVVPQIPDCGERDSGGLALLAISLI